MLTARIIIDVWMLMNYNIGKEGVEMDTYLV